MARHTSLSEVCPAKPWRSGAITHLLAKLRVASHLIPMYTTTIMLEILHSIIAILLIITIVMQSRASGLSATFGGSGTTNVVQRRGAEKLIYKASIYLSVAFFALSIIRWYVY